MGMNPWVYYHFAFLDESTGIWIDRDVRTVKNTTQYVYRRFFFLSWFTKIESYVPGSKEDMAARSGIFDAMKNYPLEGQTRIVKVSVRWRRALPAISTEVVWQDGKWLCD